MRGRFLIIVWLATLQFADAGLCADGGCTRTWDVAAVAKAAKRIEDKTVCLHALLRPIPIPRENAAVLYEFVPLTNESASAANRIGLVDWDNGLGISKSLYQPESYKLIEEARKACPHIAQHDLAFEVEVRGVVKYKKRLVAMAAEVFPKALSVEKGLLPSYDTELVVLTVLSAKPECANSQPGTAR